MTDALETLIGGYKEFYRRYQSHRYEAYRHEASQGQSPKIMVIACSDARVNPSIITHARLGEIFIVCNVANIVPPYVAAKGSHHSTSSALEFAVGTLGVEHVVVMGHSGCGGIRSLLDGPPKTEYDDYSFIGPWVSIIAGAKDHVQHLHGEERYHACECEGIKISLANLRTFPWIADRIRAGALRIHGWHFDIASGLMEAYDEETDRFTPLTE
jgi:carbonic anhydrase